MTEPTEADVAYRNHLRWKAAGCPRVSYYDGHVRAWHQHHGRCPNCQQAPCAPTCAAYKPRKLKSNWTPEAVADLRKMWGV